jgi:diketogulonate reductase-like aldo/keto reductase
LDAHTQVGGDDLVRDVVAIPQEIGCSPAQVAISWVRQQPGPVIPLIAARTEEQMRDNLAATNVHLSQQHLDRLDALRRATLGFPQPSCAKAPSSSASTTRHRRPPRANRTPHHHRHVVVWPVLLE